MLLIETFSFYFLFVFRLCGGPAEEAGFTAFCFCRLPF